MKKKLIIILATAILCIACIYIYHICRYLAGDTAESREEILNTAVQKGSDWSIVKETEIDNYSETDLLVALCRRLHPHGILMKEDIREIVNDYTNDMINRSY